MRRGDNYWETSGTCCKIVMVFLLWFFFTSVIEIYHIAFKPRLHIAGLYYVYAT